MAAVALTALLAGPNAVFIPFQCGAVRLLDQFWCFLCLVLVDRCRHFLLKSWVPFQSDNTAELIAMVGPRCNPLDRTKETARRGGCN